MRETQPGCPLVSSCHCSQVPALPLSVPKPLLRFQHWEIHICVLLLKVKPSKAAQALFMLVTFLTVSYSEHFSAMFKICSLLVLCSSVVYVN